MKIVGNEKQECKASVFDTHVITSGGISPHSNKGKHNSGGTVTQD